MYNINGWVKFQRSTDTLEGHVLEDIVVIHCLFVIATCY